ncbi:MAG: hypothetical protein K6E50_15865 [Lachnospiraceae bacterium]|nr:hypothetical protein [Lachnospiraceae bacterium]
MPGINDMSSLILLAAEENEIPPLTALLVNALLAMSLALAISFLLILFLRRERNKKEKELTFGRFSSFTVKDAKIEHEH